MTDEEHDEYWAIDPLTRAASEGDVDAVRAALAAGVDVNKCDHRAFYRAAEEGHLYVLDVLIAAGVGNDLASCRIGVLEHALMGASLEGHANVVMYMIEAGAKVHTDEFGQGFFVSINGFNPLAEAALRGYADVVDILLKSGRFSEALLQKIIELNPQAAPMIESYLMKQKLMKEGLDRREGKGL